MQQHQRSWSCSGLTRIAFYECATGKNNNDSAVKYSISLFTYRKVTINGRCFSKICCSYLLREALSSIFRGRLLFFNVDLIEPVNFTTSDNFSSQYLRHPHLHHSQLNTVAICVRFKLSFIGDVDAVWIGCIYHYLARAAVKIDLQCLEHGVDVCSAVYFLSYCCYFKLSSHFKTLDVLRQGLLIMHTKGWYFALDVSYLESWLSFAICKLVPNVLIWRALWFALFVGKGSKLC